MIGVSVPAKIRDASGAAFRREIARRRGSNFHKRAEIVSAYLIACYPGISLPVIGIVLLEKATGRVIADLVFAAFIGLLSVFALLVEWNVGKPATQNNSSR